MPPAPLFPVGLRLDHRLVVVVGGGPVGLRRVSALLQAGAQVRLVAPEATAALADLADRGRLSWERRAYQDGDLDGAWLAVACTDAPDVNAAVARAAEAARVFCVRADDASQASAWTPAVGRSGSLTVAVHADRDPGRAAAVRDQVVDLLDGSAVVRRQRPAAGRVVLVGGGPGDPGLLTVRGRAELQQADVVVVDRLAPLAVLDDLGPDVLVVDAAKVPGGRSMPQDEINRVLVEHARAGRAVVRLKGGDPFVFGRGMEEVEACVAAGVPVEVVPGVTSAIAVPALAGIPVTHRGTVQAFTVTSGHVAPSDPASTVDWRALARSGSTIVVLMGVGTMAEIALELLAGGLPGATPVACLQDGWAGTGSVRTGPLGTLAADLPGWSVTSPAVFVVGDVVLAAPGSALSG